MPRTLRIGLELIGNDYFWGQVREAIVRHAEGLGVEIVLLHGNDFLPLSTAAVSDWTTEIQTLHLDSLITLFSGQTTRPLLEHGVPVIALTESDLHHPLFICPTGFYESAYQLGCYLAEQLNGRGSLLIVGGLQDPGEAGRTRLGGLSAALRNYPEISFQHVPSFWEYEDAYRKVGAVFKAGQTRFDGVVGLTDGLALGARDRCQMLGLLHEQTVVGGFYGDPLALSAIRQGKMTATIALHMTEFAQRALDLAIQSVQQQSFDKIFRYPYSLVSAENVDSYPAQPFCLPVQPLMRHVALSHQREQRRHLQLETSLAITHRIGTILDSRQLIHEIADLIRANYDYDLVQVFRWDEHGRCLKREAADREDTAGLSEPIPVVEAGVLGQGLLRRGAIFLEDAQESPCGPLDPQWPGTQTRFIVPIYLGSTVRGLLDLHSTARCDYYWEDGIGLQALANQLGVAMHNAELYQEAVAARKRAELVDRLKTSLLANVSHELRTPIQLILGYSRAVLEASLHTDLLDDLSHIQNNAEHLAHLIDDLLDIARVEIGELKLEPEQIETRAFLETIFQDMADRYGQGEVRWQLKLPQELPLLEVDPVRLRQILLNLLSNAHKWTKKGYIVLGAAVAQPFLHLWVQDSGRGIETDLQARVFEPFVTGDAEKAGGIGLGLAITRRLVELHGGKLTVDSLPRVGSTFNVYLPISTRMLSTIEGQMVQVKDLEVVNKQDERVDRVEGKMQLLMKPVRKDDLEHVLRDTRASASAGPVLIVEDDQETREFYRQLVTHTLPDLPVLTATDGETALSMLQKETPGLVILDLQMPGIDGFTVLEQLRAMPRTVHVPVLILSGRFLTEEDLQRINHTHVTLYSKDILSASEMMDKAQRIMVGERGLAPQTSILVKQAQIYLQQSYTNKITLQEVANAVGASRNYLDRIFQQELGLSPWEYLKRYRVMKAQQLLEQTSQSINAIATHVGFQNVSYFNRLFRQYTGRSPRAYRSKHLHRSSQGRE